MLRCLPVLVVALVVVACGRVPAFFASSPSAPTPIPTSAPGLPETNCPMADASSDDDWQGPRELHPDFRDRMVEAVVLGLRNDYWMEDRMVEEGAGDIVDVNVRLTGKSRRESMHWESMNVDRTLPDGREAHHSVHTMGRVTFEDGSTKEFQMLVGVGVIAGFKCGVLYTAHRHYADLAPNRR